MPLTEEQAQFHDENNYVIAAYVIESRRLRVLHGRYDELIAEGPPKGHNEGRPINQSKSEDLKRLAEALWAYDHSPFETFQLMSR